MGANSRKYGKNHARNTRKKLRRKARVLARGILECMPAGYGFVKTAEGDFFIPKNQVNGAFDGDLVEISLRKSSLAQLKDEAGGARSGAGKKNKPQGSVMRVIERAHETLLGRFEVAEPFGVVVPEDPRITHDIFTKLADAPDVPAGALVRVRITQFPYPGTPATGVVEEVLGSADDPSVLAERIIERHKLATAFPDDALEQAKEAQVDAEGALSAGYRDLRDRFVFTIDPADAKDFDDALSIEEVSADELPNRKADEFSSYEGGFTRLGVHIADVGHYVPWGCAIDAEARKRATSVYLVDRVLPMLPEELSNDICSLKPDEDRRSMTVDLYIDDSCNLADYEIYPALIRSNARLNYDEALKLLELSDACGNAADLKKLAKKLGVKRIHGKVPVARDGGMREGDVRESARRDAEDVHPEAEQLIPRLYKAHMIALARREQRMAQGGLEFSTKEAHVRLDEDGTPTGIDVREPTASTQLVEEAMIFANEVVARHLEERRIPAAYRIHEEPDSIALEGLIPVLQEFPWFTRNMELQIPTGNPHAIQAVLDAAEGRPEEELVTMMVLRSMMRAVYSTADLGHYGLGLKSYCHFTSPIRRYPDLIVHRALHSQFPDAAPTKGQNMQLQQLCEHSSEMEHVAEMASRDSEEAKIVEYMEQFVGKTFSAVITGISTRGLFVRLANCAEGLVLIDTLGDEYFAYDPKHQKLIGTDTGEEFKLGSPVRAVLTNADTMLGRLDFALKHPTTNPKKGKKK